MIEGAIAVLVVVAVAAISVWRARRPWYTLPEGGKPKLPQLPVTPINAAPTSGPIACSGVVSAIPKERAPTTLAGMPAVWVEGIVEAGEKDEGGTIARRWPVLAFVDAVPFLLEDGSGERAKVLPSRGELLPAIAASQVRRADAETAARVLELLVRYNKAVDARTPLFYGETSIAPSDTVTVQGEVLPSEAGAPYRENARRSVVIHAGTDGLIVRRRA